MDPPPTEQSKQCGADRGQRQRRPYTCDELVDRDKSSLGQAWLKDDSLEVTENLPEPDVIAEVIPDSPRTAPEQIGEIRGDLEAIA